MHVHGFYSLIFLITTLQYVLNLHYIATCMHMWVQHNLLVFMHTIPIMHMLIFVEGMDTSLYSITGGS